MAHTRRVPLAEIGNSMRDTMLVRDKSSLIGERTTNQVKPRILPPVTALTTSPRVDDKHRGDQLYCTEYAKDIAEQLRKAEGRFRPSITYMGRQTDINEKMRTILVDWLIDVHLKFRLLPETLYLTIDIIDRFLNEKVVSRQKLQLVGVVAMLIASKYEEIYPPKVKEFIYISANTYNKEEVLRMERYMLATLDFHLTVPTIFNFLKRGLLVGDVDTTTGMLAHYISELALLDYKMLVYLPSTVAAASIFLANKVMNTKEPWSQVMQRYTTYQIGNFERCAKDLLELVLDSPSMKNQAVKKKYSSTKYSEVAKIVSNQMQSLATMEFP